VADTTGGQADTRQEVPSMVKRTTEERFWAKVDFAGPIPEYRPDLGPCWIWTGKPSSEGYGRLSIEGGRLVYAHRFAYELLIGPIPEGMESDHLCRVRLCVKAIADASGPAHLEPVTRRENVLRGMSPLAAKAARTHCGRGHELTEANTYRWPGNPAVRYCRQCRADADKRRAKGRSHGGRGRRLQLFETDPGTAQGSR
jgi:hypothetical protein